MMLSHLQAHKNETWVYKFYTNFLWVKGSIFALLILLCGWGTYFFSISQEKSLMQLIFVTTISLITHILFLYLCYNQSVLHKQVWFVRCGLIYNSFQLFVQSLMMMLIVPLGWFIVPVVGIFAAFSALKIYLYAKLLKINKFHRICKKIENHPLSSALLYQLKHEHNYGAGETLLDLLEQRFPRKKPLLLPIFEHIRSLMHPPETVYLQPLSE